MAQRQLTIEQDSVTVRLIAGPPSLVPMLLASAGVAALLAMLGTLAAGSAIRAYRRHRLSPIDSVFVLAWLALTSVVIVIVVQMIRRLRAPRGVIIDRGEVTVLVPDDAPSRYHFPLADLRAATLQRKVNDLGVVSLVLDRYSSRAIVALRHMPFDQLAPAVDALNGMLQDDRHFAFEVVLKNPPGVVE